MWSDLAVKHTSKTSFKCLYSFIFPKAKDKTVREIKGNPRHDLAVLTYSSFALYLCPVIHREAAEVSELVKSDQKQRWSKLTEQKITSVV